MPPRSVSEYSGTGGAGHTRRDFLKKALFTVVGWTSMWATYASATGRGGDGQERAQGQPRWGMVIDLDRCTACQACVVACSAENNQMLGSPAEAAMGRVIRWLKILPETIAEGPHIRQSLIPMPCQQCDNPPCTRVCPTSATFMNSEGIVGQVYDRCIGCRYCVNACPYTCKFFNWGTPTWPRDPAMSFNPDVSVRYQGVVEKCLFCHHRLERAKEKARTCGRPLQDGDYLPACAAACPAKAILFGDLNQPDSEVSRLTASRRGFRLLEELGTNPKVTYLREG